MSDLEASLAHERKINKVRDLLTRINHASETALRQIAIAREHEVLAKQPHLLLAGQDVLDRIEKGDARVVDPNDTARKNAIEMQKEVLNRIGYILAKASELSDVVSEENA